MTRLAQDRDTHLTRPEIAAEALRQFDADADGAEPSIRSLASALRVAPTAIYHHFGSRALIVQAAIELVWEEVTDEAVRIAVDPLGGDPVDTLVAGGLAVRRAFGRHYRIAPYLAATPEPSTALHEALTVVARLLERMGLSDEDQIAAFHAYATFTLGSVLFAAQRRIANAELEASRSGDWSPSGTPIDAVVDLSVVDPERDERLFVQSLARLVGSFRPSA